MTKKEQSIILQVLLPENEKDTAVGKQSLLLVHLLSQQQKLLLLLSGNCVMQMEPMRQEV